MKASKSKTGSRRLVAIAKNLKEWLAPYAKRTGLVVLKNERKMRLAAMAAAEIEVWPMDVLRHSFASYHLAMHTDIDGTALQLGHTSTKMLFQHYREAVKPTAAKEWWALRPGRKGSNIIVMKTERKAAVA